MYKYTFKDVFIHIFYKSEMLTLIVLGGVFYPNIIRVNYNEFDYFLSSNIVGSEDCLVGAGAGWFPGCGIATL